MNLIERGTFAIVLRPEKDKKLNRLPSRFVLVIKQKDDGTKVYKARFVISGHRDRWKRSLVYVSGNVRHSSVWTLLALASILGFDVWSTDVKQACLESSIPLLRDVFVKPPSDVIELGPNELLKLLKPLHGLTAALLLSRLFKYIT